jgi:hypothetical protein
MTVNNGGGGAVFAPPGIPVSAPKGHGGGGPPPNTYRAAVLADSPIAYYRLGDLTDQQGGPSGVPSGAVTAGGPNLLPTQAGASMTFAGGNIALTNNAFNGLLFNACTIEAWCKLTSFPGGSVVFYGAPGSWIGMGLNTLSQEVYWNNGDGVLPSLSTTITVGQAFHFVTAWAGPTAAVHIYINGVAVDPGGGTAYAATNTATQAYVGSQGPSTNPWNGQLQDLAVYASTLSAARVAAHYAAA